MARSVATKWILGIVIYFILLILLLTGANTFKDAYELDDSSYIANNSVGGVGYTVGSCSGPRAVINPYTGMEVFYFSNEAKCSVFGLYLDSDECDYLEGCEWANATEAPWYLRFIGLPDTPAGCYGRLNRTYYDPAESTTIVCDWPQNIDEDTCQYLGCTWQNATSDAFAVSDTHTSYTKGFFKVAETIGEVVLLRIDFATGNDTINAILTFFMIWIPLAMLLMSGYIMVR